MRFISSTLVVVLPFLTSTVLTTPSYHHPYRPQLNTRSLNHLDILGLDINLDINLNGKNGRGPSHKPHSGLPLPSITELTKGVLGEGLLAPLLNQNGSADVKKLGVSGAKYRPSEEELRELRERVAKDAKAKGLGVNGNGKVKEGKVNLLTANSKETTKAANPLSGVIAAFVAPYGFVGYVGLELTSYFHTSPLTGDLSKAAIVTLPSATPSTDFEMAIFNASHPLLGVIDGYQGPLWGVGTPGYGTMTVVESSSWPASNTNNPTGLPSESNIWSMNPSTGELTAVWFNNDGTRIDTTIFYDATYGDMNFTGDLEEYLDVYPDNCYVTTVIWVPLSYFGF